MEEKDQRGSEIRTSSNKPADDKVTRANANGGGDESQPSCSQVDVSSKRKKPWRDNFHIPLIRDKPVDDSDHDGVDTHGDTHGTHGNTVDDGEARAPARAPSPVSSSSEDSDKDGESSDSSSSGGSSSDSDSDSVVEEVLPPPAKKPRKERSGYSRFDPGEGDQVRFELSSPDMVDYASKRFTQYYSDKKLRETIMNEYPVPHGIPGVEVPVMDEYIPEIFMAKKADYGKTQDENWSKVQHRVLDVMGPLSKVWDILDTARLVGSENADLDLFEILDLVEKSITLLGQAQVSFNYFRRQGVLYRLTKDPKKAKILLKQHDEVQSKSYDKLFGKSFYKKLSKSAKIRKESREISNQLSESKPKNNSFQNNKQPNSNRGRGNQSFRGGPSSGNRGGGRKFSFSKRGKQNNNRGKCIISVCTKKRKSKYFSDRQTNRLKQSKCVRPCKIVKFKCDNVETRGHSGQACKLRPRKIVKFKSCGTKHGGPGEIRGLALSSEGTSLYKSESTPPSGGTLELVCEQLGDINPRSTHLTDSQRSPDPICGTALSTDRTVSVPTVTEGFCSDQGRDPEHVGERGHHRGLSNVGTVCQPPLSCAKEGRVTTSCDQLKKVEHLSGVLPFQDGGTSLIKGVDSTERLHDKSRPEGRLFQCPSESIPSEISEIPLGETLVPVQVYALRSGASPEAVHQVIETGDGSVTSSRGTDYCVPGRHDYPESDEIRSSDGSELATLLADAIRVCYKLEEVLPSSDPDLGFLGVHDRHHQDDSVFTTRQGGESHIQMSEVDHRKDCDSQDPSRDGRASDFVCQSNFACPPAFQTHANGTDEGFASGSVLRGKTPPTTRSSQRTTLVDPEYKNLEWSSNHYPYPRPVHRDGRFFERLGGSPEGPTDWGCLDSSGERFSHKCVRTEGSPVCYQSVYRDSPECACPSQDGQHFCSGLYPKDGGGPGPNPYWRSLRSYGTSACRGISSCQQSTSPDISMSKRTGNRDIRQTPAIGG